MDIKKLSKELIAEGITPELANAINMKTNFSPVIMQAGDKPVKLVPNSKGFWIMYESGQYLKDEKNALMVFGEKECRIARIRYLLKYGKREKAKRIDDLINSWKDLVRLSMEKLQIKITYLEKFLDVKNEEGSDTMMMIAKSMNPEGFERQKAQHLSELAQLKPVFEELIAMQAAERWVELMSIFKLKKFESFGEPMMSAQLDNEQDMKVLINTFGGKALSKWDGNMLSRYATLEIEKEYPI